MKISASTTFARIRTIISLLNILSLGCNSAFCGFSNVKYMNVLKYSMYSNNSYNSKEILNIQIKLHDLKGKTSW